MVGTGEQSVAAIRTVDNNHILFVENPLSADWAFRLIPDANVVYLHDDYTPFLVSHAGADWVGDSPMPVTFHYPGPVIEATEWADWSQDATQFTDATADWLTGQWPTPPCPKGSNLPPSNQTSGVMSVRSGSMTWNSATTASPRPSSIRIWKKHP